MKEIKFQLSRTQATNLLTMLNNYTTQVDLGNAYTRLKCLHSISDSYFPLNITLKKVGNGDLSYKIIDNYNQPVDEGTVEEVFMCLYLMYKQPDCSKERRATIYFEAEDLYHLMGKYKVLYYSEFRDAFRDLYKHFDDIDHDGEIRCTECLNYHSRLFVDISLQTPYFMIGMECRENETNDFAIIFNSEKAQRFDLIKILFERDLTLYGTKCEEPKPVAVSSARLPVGKKKSNNKMTMEEKKEAIKDIINKTDCVKYNDEKEEENKNMFNLKGMFNGMEFGAVKGDMFKMSMYGVAFKNEDRYVAYDINNNEMIDVDVMNFDADGLIMQMPVAISAVKAGDIIMHQGKPVIVKTSATALKVIEPATSEVKQILPIKNMFGFNFVTKVMPLIDFSTVGASSDNPFGNMMPLIAMSSMMDGEQDSMKTMLMMNMMNGGSMDMQSMMPLMLLGNKDNSSMLETIMMMNMMGGNNNIFGNMFSMPAENNKDEENK